MYAEGWKSKENKKEMLEIENTVKDMISDFDGLISRWDSDEERISELDDIAIGSLTTKEQREQKYF